MPGSSSNTLSGAKKITKVSVERGSHDITIVIQADGRLAYRIFPIDGNRLGLDLPHVVSSISFQVLPVDHALLKSIRIGHHPKKLRLVFDINHTKEHPIRYAVKGRGNVVAVRLTNVK